MSTSAIPPDGFKLSKSIRTELPESERDRARDELWTKSATLCALCDEPLPADGRFVDVDHVVARVEGAGGKTVLSNLFVAHRKCNRSRQNMPFALAKRIIRFQHWAASDGGKRTFDDVIEEY
ncbi:MAG: HNH endonuclease signature motif containing protein, partial [Solirubrobacterales bacterium]|nr:HNH endonuclease signature motif containing protein [Solirubrobacterales bacterium]